MIVEYEGQMHMTKPGICNSKLTGPRTGNFVVFHFCFGIIPEASTQWFRGEWEVKEWRSKKGLLSRRLTGERRQ